MPRKSNKRALKKGATKNKKGTDKKRQTSLQASNINTAADGAPVQSSDADSTSATYNKWSEYFLFALRSLPNHMTVEFETIDKNETRGISKAFIPQVAAFIISRQQEGLKYGLIITACGTTSDDLEFLSILAAADVVLRAKSGGNIGITIKDRDGSLTAALLVKQFGDEHKQSLDKMEHRRMQLFQAESEHQSILFGLTLDGGKKRINRILKHVLKQMPRQRWQYGDVWLQTIHERLLPLDEYMKEWCYQSWFENLSFYHWLVHLPSSRRQQLIRAKREEAYSTDATVEESRVDEDEDETADDGSRDEDEDETTDEESRVDEDEDETADEESGGYDSEDVDEDDGKTTQQSQGVDNEQENNGMSSSD